MTEPQLSTLEIQELTADDLAQNRSGRVSPVEQARTRARLTRLQLLPLVLSLGGVVGGTTLACFFVSLRVGNWSAMIAPGVIGAALAPIYLTWWLLGYRRPMRELAVGLVAMLEGPIERGLIGDYSSTFFIRVGGKRLRGFGLGGTRDRNHPLFSRLRALREDKTPIRAFYLPRSRVLLAFEPLERA